MSALDDNYDPSDPYDQAALVYGIFVCEECGTSEGFTEASTYHTVGQNARQRGWLVEPRRALPGGDWIIKCPRCRDLK
jgi:hypothetical protein